MRSTATCTVIHPGHTYDGKQGLTYFEGVSAESTGAQGISMHLLTIPPGGRARAHLHETHETTIYILSGESEMWYGDQLGERLTVRAGELLYIPANMPHLPMNTSDEPCTCILARTDPNEQERECGAPSRARALCPGGATEGMTADTDSDSQRDGGGSTRGGDAHAVPVQLLDTAVRCNCRNGMERGAKRDGAGDACSVAAAPGDAAAGSLVAEFIQSATMGRIRQKTIAKHVKDRIRLITA